MKLSRMISRLLLLFSLLLLGAGLQAQGFLANRPSIYAFTGTSGANLSQFNALLDERGILPIQNKYNSFGLGYQARLNDFIFGFELSQHQSQPAEIGDHRFQYRTSRALVNLGYSLTEEGKFQLIHYLSLGLGYMNVQMLPQEQSKDLNTFLKEPGQGFILRENDIQKGTRYYGNFLTEIGFQLSYDFPIPNRKEALVVIAKAGYAFSPFEDSWNLSGISFDNAQAGAFFRVGTGISLPDRNFFTRMRRLASPCFEAFTFPSLKNSIPTYENRDTKTLKAVLPSWESVFWVKQTGSCMEWTSLMWHNRVGQVGRNLIV